eukprot:TRINITY_DN90666_c0_g1_i1.p1 TRINITY_DN90666_c0_g1~~TRINITY_DN90666_c0_g1_i1.p1  ORF type:complete len:495 (-),score=134.10 TRINITY_DN90666_c0_g1_i1:53-1537(-)
MGFFLDDIFAYETQKIVRIRDRRLGFTYLGLVLLIILYVVGFQIFYDNGHFLRKDVFGTARMTIQQPTKKGCNPNDPDCDSDYPALTELPYCSVYNGTTDNAPKYKRKCIFADQHTLMPFGMLKGEMLVPTRIDTMAEFKECNPGPENGYTCLTEYRAPKKQEVVYVADIEKYTVLVSHSYKRSYISGNNAHHQGFLQKCVEEEQDDDDKIAKATKNIGRTFKGRKECEGKLVYEPIECIVPGKCLFKKEDKSDQKKNEFMQKNKAAKHHRRHGHPEQDHIQLAAESLEAFSEDTTSPGELVKGGLFAIADGDIFSVQKLLELSGLNLDDTFNRAGEPLREAGTVIEIEAIYNNLHPIWSSFGNMDVGYHYKVSQRPMEEMKTELFAAHQPNFPDERIIENRHGLYIVVKIGGEFGFFSVVYLLVMLTTALGLIGVAVLLTDKIALYLMAAKEEYRGRKYEESQRFGGDDDELFGEDAAGETKTQETAASASSN